MTTYIPQLTVTDINMKIKENGAMKAICCVILNDSLAINHIRVIADKEDKLFMAMPSKKMPDGTFKDCCHTINAQARELIEKAIIDEYHKQTTLSEDISMLIGV